MKIAYIGSYKADYSRNKIIIDGLKRNNVDVVEINIRKKFVNFKLSRLISLIEIFISPLISIKSGIALLLKSLHSNISQVDCIIVGFPGTLDLPFVAVVSMLFKKPIFYDGLVSAYDTYVSDRMVIKNNLFSVLIYKFEKILYKIPTCIFVDTEANRRFFIKKFKINPKKIKVIYLGADNKIYKPGNMHKRNFMTVVFYGYASPLHGIEYIIKAAQICNLKKKNIKFILLGDGQTKKENEQLANKIGATNVTFLPSMSEISASKIINDCDVFLGVFNRTNKSKRVIPNKVYQGLAMKKTVLTSNSPAIQEVFKHKLNIYLCNPADHQSLANSILNLERSRELRERISQKGWELYQSNFTPEKIGHSMVQLVHTYI